jgi:hypothetical protein
VADLREMAPLPVPERRRCRRQKLIDVRDVVGEVLAVGDADVVEVQIPLRRRERVFGDRFFVLGVLPLDRLLRPRVLLAYRRLLS